MPRTIGLSRVKIKAGKIPRVRLAGTFGRGLLDREVHGTDWEGLHTICGMSIGYDYPPQSTQDSITCNACLKALA